VTTNVLLSIDELPRDPDGVILGAYYARDRHGDDTLEVGQEPFESGGITRLDAALSDGVTWLPADRETAERAARHLHEIGGAKARVKAVRALYPRPRRRSTKKAPRKNAAKARDAG